MKNFSNWGLKIRRDLSRNYYSLWMDLKTYRMDLGPEIKLPYGESEFYDCGITSRCNAECKFCYVSAGHGGADFEDICGTWKRWMDIFPPDEPIILKDDPILRDIIAPPSPGEKLGPDELELKLRVFMALKPGNKNPAVYTYKPTQIAIGSTGEPTIHPDLPHFLETVYETGVVPNYTTNGLHLPPEVLEATKAFCGGVAVSYGNRSLRSAADKTINTLLKEGECKVMIHHLIYDIPSVDDFLKAAEEWGTDIHYHVLLPLKAHGRSTQEMTEEAYLYLTTKIREKGLHNLAFGMWFLPWMKKYPGSLEVYDYPAETYSSNVLLKDRKVLITPSSYDLRVVKEI